MFLEPDGDALLRGEDLLDLLFLSNCLGDNAGPADPQEVEGNLLANLEDCRVHHALRLSQAQGTVLVPLHADW